jgi:hypothetical protein
MPLVSGMKIVSRRWCLIFAGLVLGAQIFAPICARARAEGLDTKTAPGIWDVEQYRTGLVAVSRARDHRTALMIFCTLYGTRNIVYAFDGRGMRSEDIPISEVRVRLTPTIDVMGLIVPSSAATFDNDGYIIRMKIRVPEAFDPVGAATRTIGSGPGALPQNRWSVAVGEAGLDESVRIAFKNCV